MTEEEAEEEEDDVVVRGTPLFCHVVSSPDFKNPMLFILLHATSNHIVMVSL